MICEPRTTVEQIAINERILSLYDNATNRNLLPKEILLYGQSRGACAVCKRPVDWDNVGPSGLGMHVMKGAGEPAITHLSCAKSAVFLASAAKQARPNALLHAQAKPFEPPLRSTPYQPISLAVRNRIGQKARWRCWLCGGTVDPRLRFSEPLGATMDHVRPRSAAGANDFDNLRLAHKFCNERRGSRSPLAGWFRALPAARRFDPTLKEWHSAGHIIRTSNLPSTGPVLPRLSFPYCVTVEREGGQIVVALGGWKLRNEYAPHPWHWRTGMSEIRSAVS